jgi:hypothetical protein
MPLTPYMSKQILDWQTGAAAATQPPGRWLQWATASPTTASAFDGPFSSRRTCTFAAANSPQGSATNLGAVTGATVSVAATAVGWNLYDSSVGGNRIAFGTVAAAVGCKSGDAPVFSAGALKITIS